MSHTDHTQRLARTEEALTVLFCLIDDAYALLNPKGRRYESLKRPSDMEGRIGQFYTVLKGVQTAINKRFSFSWVSACSFLLPSYSRQNWHPVCRWEIRMLALA
jgi:hypothetical protein